VWKFPENLAAKALQEAALVAGGDFADGVIAYEGDRQGA